MDRSRVVRRSRALGAKPIIPLAILFWLALSLASYWLVVVDNEQRFDFYPRWVGARAVLRGDSPYSAPVTEDIQRGMFGRTLGPEEDQQRFAYTATITWLLLGFWMLPFSLSISLWMGLQLLLLLILPLWVASILRWQPNLPSFVLLLLFSTVVFRYPMNAFLIGQFIPFCLGALVAAWWGMLHERWVVATAALVLAMVRPEVVFIPLVTLLVVAWRLRLRQITIGWAVVMLFSWLWTRFWIGPWEVDYVQGLLAYQAYSSPIWPPGLVGETWIAATLILAVLGWTLWIYRRLDGLNQRDQIGWLLATSALLSLIILPQTGNYTLILGLLPVWIILATEPMRRGLYWIPVALILSSPWIFHLMGAELSKFEHLIIPLSLGLLLSLKLIDMGIAHQKGQIRLADTN